MSNVFNRPNDQSCSLGKSTQGSFSNVGNYANSALNQNRNPYDFAADDAREDENNSYAAIENPERDDINPYEISFTDVNTTGVGTKLDQNEAANQYDRLNRNGLTNQPKNVKVSDLPSGTDETSNIYSKLNEEEGTNVEIRRSPICTRSRAEVYSLVDKSKKNSSNKINVQVILSNTE